MRFRNILHHLKSSDLILFFFSVSVLGGYNYTYADFMMIDVYDSIKTYLSVNASGQSSEQQFL